jgi:hypothetical protein
MKHIQIFLLLALVGAAAAEPSIVEYDNPKVVVSGNTVYVTLYLTNEGSLMTSLYIVELQPRPAGQLPLTAVSEQSTCDPTMPNNVHRSFKLESGESRSLTLSTSLGKAGKYDLYVLGRTKCWAEQPQGNAVIGPWGSWRNIKTVDIGSGGLGGINWNIAIGMILIIVAVYLAMQMKK